MNVGRGKEARKIVQIWLDIINMILAINELQIKYLIILDYFKRSFYLQFLLLCISLFIYLMKISRFHFLTVLTTTSIQYIVHCMMF